MLPNVKRRRDSNQPKKCHEFNYYFFLIVPNRVFLFGRIFAGCEYHYTKVVTPLYRNFILFKPETLSYIELFFFTKFMLSKLS
jgi:hypothetical protein